MLLACSRLPLLPRQDCRDHVSAQPTAALSLQCRRADAQRISSQQGPERRRRRHVVTRAAVPGGGAGVIDRPTTMKPGISEKNVTKKKKPPIYRVMLHNDSFNRREYVVSVLLKVVDGLAMDEAVNVMQEAHINGLACVIACSQEEAEKYCEGLRNNGLISSLEPDSGG